MQHSKLTLFVTVVFLIFHTSVQGQSKSNWQSIFNGKNFNGWKQLNGKAKYTISNGVITGTTVFGEPNSFMATEKIYDDFILEFDFKVDSTMNSGVQFRSESKPDYMNGRVYGYQYEIDPSPRAWTGGIYDEARRGWLYPMGLNPSAQLAFRQGVWNRARIECIGNSIKTWLNGVPAAHLIDNVGPKGFIALQVHSIQDKKDEGRQISWKNIRIQTQNLKASPDQKIFIANTISNNLSDAEKRNGVTLLFDGLNTNQWRGAYKTDFPKLGWKVENEVLKVLPASGGESTNGGDIVTKNKYKAFIFQFDFKLTEGANSGVKYYVTEKEKNTGSAIGLEYQLLDDAKHPDAKLGVVNNRTLASLYDLIPSSREPRARKPIGEWNRGVIIAYPTGVIQHWLNGFKVLEYNRNAQYFPALVARSKYAEWPDFGRATEGYILLQDHGNEVWYRNLKIQEIK